MILPAPSKSCQAVGGVSPTWAPPCPRWFRLPRYGLQDRERGWAEEEGLYKPASGLLPGQVPPPEPASLTPVPAGEVTESRPVQLAGHVSQAHTGHIACVGESGHGQAGAENGWKVFIGLHGADFV